MVNFTLRPNIMEPSNHAVFTGPSPVSYESSTHPQDHIFNVLFSIILPQSPGFLK
jgi:hypothetical protein